MSPSKRRKVQLALSIIIISLAIILSYYSVVEITRTQASKGPTDIYLTLDVSGSMNDPSGNATKIVQAQASAAQFVNIIKPELETNFTVGLIAFNDQATPLVHLTRDNSAVLSAIASLRADGRTAIGDALRLATNLLMQEGRPGTRRVILLMTDGLSNADQFMTPVEAADLAALNRINVHTVAFGSDADSALLQNIAQKTGGEFYTASTGEELLKSFSTVAQNLLAISPTVHYGSRALILVALPLMVFLPEIERGVTRTYQGLTTLLRKETSVLKGETHARGRAVCVRCENPIRLGVVFCTHCGLPAKSSIGLFTVCQTCRTPLRKGIHFCTKCGARVPR